MAETTTKKYLDNEGIKKILGAAKGWSTTAFNDAKQYHDENSLTAGTGISISGGVISATGTADVDPSALPAATKTAKGAVIVGDGISVDASGTISVDFTPTLNSAKSYTDTKIGDLIGGAPETFDTLKEIADYIAEHADVVTAINAAIGNKADKAATIAGYGITDAKIVNGVITLGTATVDTKTFATTTAMNTALANKADKGTKLSDYGIADAKIASGTITLGTQSIKPVVAADLVPYAKSADFVPYTEAELDAIIAAVA